jgi:hypothetical protein
MIESDTKSHDLELINAFSGSRSVQKADLRNFYYQHSRAATEQAFRRFVYGLEKRQIITPIGAGVYAFHDKSSQKAAKKKRFSPNWSQELVVLNKVVQEAFPNIQYLGWETRVSEPVHHRNGKRCVRICFQPSEPAISWSDIFGPGPVDDGKVCTASA